MDQMELMMVLGANKAEKIYKGMACSTDFRRVSLPAKFRDVKV
jgi:hypothetical protein